MENEFHMQCMDAVRYIYRSNRALGLHLMKMRICIVDAGRYGTAFTDRYRIYITGELREQCNTRRRLGFVLAHEALHRIFGHFSKEHCDFIKKRINSGFNLGIYKLACELEVNLWIMKNLDVDIFVPQPPVKDKWLAADMNAFELYNDMINDPEYLEIIISDLTG